MPRVDVSTPRRLSSNASTRATAYSFANKALRVGDVTHAVWLDGVSSVMAAAFDHRAGAWSVPVHVGDGKDNHACPALTAAPDGRLRLAYGPRSCADPFSDEPMDCWAMGKFRLVESVDPGGASTLNKPTQWRRLSHTGYAATYGCLVTDHIGRDHLVYNGGSAPPAARYERRQPDDSWDRDAKLMHQPVGHNYTHTGASLAVAPDGTIYSAFHFYALPRDTSLGVCVLKSADGGETWRGMDDRAVGLPIEFTPEFAAPTGGAQPFLGSLAIDHAGRLLIVTNDMGDSSAGCLISMWNAGAWRSTQLDGFMPAGWRIQHCNVTVDSAGRWLVVVDAVDARVPSVMERWAHPSSEVFLLASQNEGRSFTCVPVSAGLTGDDAKPPGCAHWLPTISRTGPNHDLRSPLILFTQGVSGTGRDCRDPERGKVFAAWVK